MENTNYMPIYKFLNAASFKERRLVYQETGRPPEGMTEQQKTKERADHNKILSDIEAAKKNDTCYKIIDAVVKAIEPLKTKKKGFEDMHAKFIKLSEQARHQVKTHWAGESVANKNGTKKIKNAMKGPIKEYRARIDQVLAAQSGAPAGPASSPAEGAPAATAETPEEIKAREAAEREEATRRVAEATIVRLDNVAGMPERIEEQRTMNAIIKLAKNETPTKDEQTALKSYILGIPDNTSKALERTEQGMPVRIIIACSDKGKIYKVKIVAGGQIPAGQGKQISQLESYLDNNAKKTNKPNPKKVNFPDTTLVEKASFERFPNTDKGNIGQALKLIKENNQVFDSVKPRLTALINKLNLIITIGNVQTLDLGNGYRLAYGKDKKSNARDTELQPDIVMFYQGKPICFRLPSGLQYADPNPEKSTVDKANPDNYQKRVALMRAAHLTMDEALKKVQFREDTKDPIFQPPQILADIKIAAAQVAKYNVEFPQAGYWERSYPGTKITYHTKEPRNGEFEITIQGKTFVINTKNEPPKGTPTPARSEVGGRVNPDTSRGAGGPAAGRPVGTQAPAETDVTGNAEWRKNYNQVGAFNEGLAWVKKGAKFGFVDKTGKVVIPLEYDAVYNFEEGLGPVKKGGKMGFINKTGKVVIPLKYDAVKEFKQGRALVTLNKRTFYIDTKGNEIKTK